jgi:hypothetical protein
MEFLQVERVVIWLGKVSVCQGSSYISEGSPEHSSYKDGMSCTFMGRVGGSGCRDKSPYIGLQIAALLLRKQWLEGRKVAENKAPREIFGPKKDKVNDRFWIL